MLSENVMYAPEEPDGGADAGRAKGRSKSGCDQSDPHLREQGDWVASGLEWKEPLLERPEAPCSELVNAPLADALRRKSASGNVEFTQEEWDAFGIGELSSLLATYYLLLATYYSRRATHDSLLATCYSPLITHSLLLTTCYR